MDITTLALAKAYTQELVKQGLDIEEIKQNVSEKVEELLKDMDFEISGGSIAVDWSINDETVAGYIKNRTHYSEGIISIPVNLSDGTEQYWTGPTGTEEYGKDYFISTQMDEIPFYVYRIADEPISLEDMGKIKQENLVLNMSGNIISGDEAFEEYEMQEMIPGVLTVLIADDIPVLANLTQELDLSTIGQEGVASKGTYFLYAQIEEQIVYLTKVNYERIKQLDLKYIPDIAFGDIDMVDYGTYAKVTVTKRDGTVQTIYINDGTQGNTPIRGTDYWTETDKAEIKAYVDNAILQGVW